MSLVPRVSLKSLLAVSIMAAPLSLAAVGLSGCSKQYIPNTEVEENDFNWRVVEFCEKYRRAVEKRNVALLLQMADSTYYEDGGTIDPSDDIDYAGLKDYLSTKFRETSSIRYEIRYRRVQPTDRSIVQVDYTYSASYKLPTEEGESWRRSVADNRLELRPEGESFKIISGM
ncbi:MAG TPA: hypothetical protein VFQ61_36410 [Polyangiaceae bacterium]|nr:hypothetical protein [Polyangiaceae bacterium]